MERDHHEAHGHAHHGAGHIHGPKDFGAMFAIATGLNVGLVAVQVFYGVAAHSVALLADAGHNFGDAVGLVIAWTAYVLARLNPTARYTYGFRSASILAALLNGVILLVVTGAIAWEAIQRLFEPGEVAGVTIIIIAAIGIVINALSAWLLMAGQRNDLNVRGAFLHMAGDAAVSLGVVIAGVLIIFTGLNWLDPAVSILISAVIVWGTWRLIREAVNMALDAVPPGVDAAAVRSYLSNLPGVGEVHDLHIWAMSTTETALTVHLVCAYGRADDSFLTKAAHDLGDRFGIHHSTIQVETGAQECRLAPANIV
jgi:cobalt-zinc-cadmium efflux system protein